MNTFPVSVMTDFVGAEPARAELKVPALRSAAAVSPGCFVLLHDGSRGLCSWLNAQMFVQREIHARQHACIYEAVTNVPTGM
jgi:hypothetical protein